MTSATTTSAAREAARHADGRFGSYTRTKGSAGAITLPRPATPVEASLADTLRDGDPRRGAGVETISVAAEHVLPGDVLGGGDVAVSEPVDHQAYVSVVARCTNGVMTIRSWDKGYPLVIGRPLTER